MRGNSDSSDTYPFRSKQVVQNLPMSSGGYGVFNTATQEFVEGHLYETEPEAIGAAHALKKANRA